MDIDDILRNFTRVVSTSNTNSVNKVYRRKLLTLPIHSSERICAGTASVQEGVCNCKVPISVMIPLYFKGHSVKVRDSIRCFRLLNSQLHNVLLKVTFSNGEIYYGTHGIILDRHFSPLLLCLIEGSAAEMSVPKLLVSPSVVYGKNCFHKYIVKTVMPYYLTYGKVVIENLSKYEVECPYEDINADINRTLSKLAYKVSKTYEVQIRDAQV